MEFIFARRVVIRERRVSAAYCIRMRFSVCIRMRCVTSWLRIRAIERRLGGAQNTDLLCDRGPHKTIYIIYINIYIYISNLPAVSTMEAATALQGVGQGGRALGTEFGKRTHRRSRILMYVAVCRGGKGCVIGVGTELGKGLWLLGRRAVFGLTGGEYDGSRHSNGLHDGVESWGGGGDRIKL
ncbi:hypothetical protein T492DRAFT_220414 [Pavlovales sp. CCMP2436]|nr:hypothetical protein T492DRAFT_220414 [Pavlovales sp. CCMP2436]